MKKNRPHRTLGVLAMAGLIAGLGLPGGAEAASVDGPKVEWKLSTWGKSRGATAGFEKMSELVAKATDGNFKITIVYGGALSPPKEQLDGLEIGAFEMALVAAGFTPGKLPAAMGLSLPFLPTPKIDNVRDVRRAYFRHPAIINDLGRWNTFPAMQLLVTPNEFVGKGAPPLKLSDWKGKRVRALGGAAKAIARLGAVPANMPSSEMYGALERGLIDAAASPLYALAAFRLQELGSWYTANMSLSVASGFIGVNKKALDALPPQYRKLLEDSVEPSLDHWVSAYAKANAKALDAFKKKNMTPVTYSPAVIDNMIQMAAQPIWDGWVKDVTAKGIPGQELLDLILKTAKESAARHG